MNDTYPAITNPFGAVRILEQTMTSVTGGAAAGACLDTCVHKRRLPALPATLYPAGVASRSPSTSTPSIT